MRIFYRTCKLSRLPNEGWEWRRLGTEDGFWVSLTWNICSTPTLLPFHHNIACGNTRQQWPTSAHRGFSRFRSRKGEWDRSKWRYTLPIFS